ncbi:MAG: response regulator transcription factor, partial [Verrucomicrobiota bacterium]
MTTVVIIDDHRMFREGLTLLFSDQEEIDVLAMAEDGVRGLELIREKEPDVALVDLAMPGMSGLSLSRALREDELTTRVIVLTTSDDPAHAIEALALGAAGYILKEEAFHSLLSGVREVADGGRYVSPKLMTAIIQKQMEAEDRPELSPRENEVLTEIATGKTSKEISGVLG